MPIRVDLWAWWGGVQRQAFIEHDTVRQRMFHYNHRGFDVIESDPAQALQLFTKGAEMAREINDPWVELFYEYWRTEVLVYYSMQIQEGLQQAIHTFTMAHESAYSQCPVVGRVYRILSDIYAIIDPVGYADKIRDMVTHMWQHVPMDDDTEMLLQRRQASLHYYLEEWDLAEEEIMKYLAQVRHIPYRERDAYSFLYLLAYRKKDFSIAYQYAINTERGARLVRREKDAGTAMIMQAVTKLHFGEVESAKGLFQRAMLIFQDVSTPLGYGYYHHTANYYELLGDPQMAVRVRETGIQEALTSNHAENEREHQLRLLRLRGRMGVITPEHIEATKALSTKLLKPEIFLRRIARVENGDYGDDD